MKNFAIMAVLALLSFSNIQAQPKQKCNWQEKMMSEKIAFITMELQLTPEEAQVFWPVYNQISQKNKETQKAMNKAYRAMVKALEEGTVSDKELNALLDDYLAAKQAHKEAYTAAAAVLSEASLSSAPLLACSFVLSRAFSGSNCVFINEK